jgi:hypothetical protein
MVFAWCVSGCGMIDEGTVECAASGKVAALR